MITFLKRFILSVLAILLAIVVVLVALVGGAAVVMESMMGVEMKPIKRGSALVLSMDEMIVESPSISPLINIGTMSLNTTPTISLLSALSALEFAQDDPNITAIVLHLDGDQTISLACASEIREALMTLRKESSKPIFAFAESYSQVEYYLASVADEIYVSPLGGIEWQGLSINGLYFGDLLKKWGIKTEVFRPAACTYKSAVEPFTSSSMSPESREQSGRLATQFWDGITSEVAKARGIDSALVRRVAREDIYIEGERAVELGLITGVKYYDEMETLLRGAGVAGEDKLRRVSFANYAAMAQIQIDEQNNTLGFTDNKIALIYADGAIVDGVRGAVGQEEVVSGEIVKQLRKARLDDEIKAVVVRVNSPGGSALAADVIWREMELVQRHKPLIVSMGSYAASGGYYISAPADYILANRYTLTGSIGVYSLLFAYEDAMRNHLDITVDGVGTSPSADFGRVAREVNPAERAMMMKGVDKVYRTFQQKVGKGRDMSEAVVAVLSGGRVWSGEEAVQCGLADDIGGLMTALQLSAERSGLSGKVINIVEYGAELEGFDLFVSQLLGGTKLDIYKIFGVDIPRADGVMMECPLRVQL